METITVGGRALPVWPQGQAIQRWLEPTVLITKFADWADYHDSLRSKILELSATPRSANEVGDGTIGSMKIYDVDKWDCPAATLVHRRACELFRIATRSPKIVVDLSWGTMYRTGDYFLPHSHPRTLASLLYAVDLGESPDAHNGQFCFADPRMKVCCREQEGYMSTPCAPVLEPGTMIMFPGQTVHFVTLYRGERPRITMSWNINHAPVAGDPIPYKVNRLR